MDFAQVKEFGNDILDRVKDKLSYNIGYIYMPLDKNLKIFKLKKQKERIKIKLRDLGIGANFLDGLLSYITSYMDCGMESEGKEHLRFEDTKIFKAQYEICSGIEKIISETKNVPKIVNELNTFMKEKKQEYTANITYDYIMN